MTSKVKVTLRRGMAGTSQKQRGTVKALGLGKVGSSNILVVRPEISGMLTTVQHLVTIETVDA
jgi:large subunit ribosomal protein L30